MEQQRHAALAAERESTAQQAAAAAHQLALDAAHRAEASLREQLVLAERQLSHQSGEVQALREANDKLQLAATALKVRGMGRCTSRLPPAHGF